MNRGGGGERLTLELCLATKTSAGDWTYDETAWFPTVHPVEKSSSAASSESEDDPIVSDEKRARAPQSITP